MPPRYERVAAKDNIVREDTTLEALAALQPVFDRKYGTITAGNASPLTDGAAALVLMSEEKARALGLRRRSASCARTPTPRSTRATSCCRARRTRRRSRSTAPACSSRTWTSSTCTRRSPRRCSRTSRRSRRRTFAEKELGRAEPLGEVDPAKLNVNGGSIALGHPFAATGARMILQTLRELERRKGQHALLTVCAAGGLGAALVLERE